VQVADHGIGGGERVLVPRREGEVAVRKLALQPPGFQDVDGSVGLEEHQVFERIGML